MADKFDLDSWLEEDEEECTVVPFPNSLPKSKTQRRFERFHLLNPHVYNDIEDIALSMHAQWDKNNKGSISLIYERLRWLHAVKTRGEKYRLSNDFRAYYARLVMARNPKLDGFFNLRSQDNEYIIDWAALGMIPPLN